AGAVLVCARSRRLPDHVRVVRDELLARNALVAAVAELVYRWLDPLPVQRTGDRVTVPPRGSEAGDQLARGFQHLYRVSGPTHDLLRVGPVLRTRRVLVGEFQERVTVGRVTRVDRVVQPTHPPRGTVVAVRVEAGVVGPHREEPVLDLRRVAVVDDESRGSG